MIDFDDVPSCGFVAIVFIVIVVIVVSLGYCQEKHVAESCDTGAPVCYGHLKQIGYIDADGSNIAVLKDEVGRQYFKCPVHMGVVLVPVPGYIDVVAEKE